MNNSLAVCILSHQIPNPHPHHLHHLHHHLPLICKGDRREVLIKVIKRTNLIKSGAGFFLFFFFILEGGVEVSVYVERDKKKKFQGYICILKHSGKVLFHV